MQINLKITFKKINFGILSIWQMFIMLLIVSEVWADISNTYSALYIYKQKEKGSKLRLRYKT